MTSGPCALSVVVPHYGDPSVAEHLLAGLLPQLGGADAEVVVVDDASPRPFPAWAGPEPVRVVRREANGGFGTAVNTGARLARGALLLVANSDLAVPATFLRDLLDEYAAHTDGLAGPAVLGPTGEPSRTGRHWPTPLGQAVSWCRPLGRLVRSPGYLDLIGIDHRARPGQTLDVDWVSGAALLVPAATFQAVGGFDERYYMYAEELDLQRRLAARGVRRTYLGSVTVSHEGGGSTDPDRARTWLVGSLRRYLTTWGGHRRFQVLLTVATAVNLLWNLARRAGGQRTRPAGTALEELRLIWSAATMDDPRASRVRRG